MHRRGQVTAFIIIGFLLLLGVGLSLFLMTREVTRLEPRVDVPADVRPVFDYVQGCLHEVATEGLNRMGSQGGYLNIPALIGRTPTAYIPIDPQGVFKTPLWYHEGELRIPALGEMERELAVHIRGSLRDCVDLAALEPEFAIEEAGPPVPTVELGEEGVTITVQWPLKVTKAGKTTDLDLYIEDLDVPLRRMWELAKTVLEEENRVSFFENATLGLLVANDDIPFSGMEFGCTVKRWRVAEVRQAIQETLANNLPYVRVEGLASPAYEESLRVYNNLAEARERMQRELEEDKETLTRPRQLAADAYEYFRLTFRPGVSEPDLRMAFDYQPSWGIRLNIQPNDGSLLKSNLGKGARKYLPFFCMNQWHFAYDLIYPLRASIYAPKALKGDGYRFQYGFPVVLEDNEPARRVFGHRRFISTESAVEYCETPGDITVDVRALGAIDGGFPDQLDQANVTFRCVALECPLGRTGADEGQYRLRTALPEGCTGGVLIAAKDGYFPQSVPAPGRGGTVDIVLPELLQLPYTVTKHPYFEVDQRLDATGQPLGPNDRVIIQIGYRNGSLDQVLPYPRTNQSETVAWPVLTGHYDVSIQLYDAFGNVIGGYEAESLKIPVADVAGATAIEFHVFEHRPVPKTTEERVRMYTYLTDGDYKERLRPEFT